MNMIRCTQGHFYDGDKNLSCPYCNRHYPAADVDPNATVSKAQISSEGATVKKPVTPPQKPVENPADLDRTISTAALNIKTSGKGPEKTIRPVVGWLACISGPDVGADYRLIAGHNFIGRSPDQNVCIKNDTSISRQKHGVVTYEPVMNKFYVHPGDSHELCYLNGNVVLGSQELIANDILTLGNTKLIFIPCCTDVFHWDPEKIEGGKDNV